MVTLVFGIGYIGSRLVQELLYQGREVIGFDNLFSSDRRAIDSFTRSPGFQFAEGSILDGAAIASAIEDVADVDGVYLLAAQASGHPDAAPPEYTEDVNMRGVRLVLDALVRRMIVAPIVYASSTRVYGSPLPPRVDESTPYGGFSDLAHLTKCYSEKLIELYARRHDLNCRVVRIGLTYGVAPVMKTDRRFMTAPNLFCLQAARGDSLDVRTADAVALAHVEDVARGLLWAGERVAEPGYRIYNLAPQVATIGSIADTVSRLARERELPPVEVRRSMPEDVSGPTPTVSSRLTSSGFVSRRTVPDGLAETLDHFLVRGQ